MFDYDSETGEIWVYDQIGPSWAGMIDSASIHEALGSMGGRDITLRVSSPGGSVFDAVDIYNMLERYPGRVEAEIDGLAASAASFLILPADIVRAARNSTVMIHRAMSITYGNSEEHAKTIEMLDKIDGNLVGMYEAKTGKPTEEIDSMLSAETWMTAAEAKEFGLVDEIVGERDAPADVPEGMYQNTPAALLKKPQAGSKTKFFPKRHAAKAKALTLCNRQS